MRRQGVPGGGSARFRPFPSRAARSKGARVRPRAMPMCRRQVGFFYPPGAEFAGSHKFEDPFLGRYDVGNTTHVATWTLRPRSSGRFIGESARMHTHRARFAGYILVRGAHTLKSLGGLPDKCYAARLGGIDSDACTTLAGARAALLEEAADKVLCRDDPDVPNFGARPSGTRTRPHFGRGARDVCRRACSCARGDQQLSSARPRRRTVCASTTGRAA